MDVWVHSAAPWMRVAAHDDVRSSQILSGPPFTSVGRMSCSCPHTAFRQARRRSAEGPNEEGTRELGPCGGLESCRRRISVRPCTVRHALWIRVAVRDKVCSLALSLLSFLPCLPCVCGALPRSVSSNHVRGLARGSHPARTPQPTRHAPPPPWHDSTWSQGDPVTLSLSRSLLDPPRHFHAWSLPSCRSPSPQMMPFRPNLSFPAPPASRHQVAGQSRLLFAIIAICPQLRRAAPCQPLTLLLTSSSSCLRAARIPRLVLRISVLRLDLLAPRELCALRIEESQSGTPNSIRFTAHHMAFIARCKSATL
ncbi:hypothetical protein DFH09DRAFT_1422848 [Mycena vulgaris]|nr:hypothetical protein DFH09DRAFT_1422848 [Mycena vulgaris]